jgi:hypothetical protein
MGRRIAMVGMVGFLFAARVAAHAQLALYVMGSGGTVGANAIGNSSGFTAYGGTVGGYDNFLGAGPLKLGADARYFVQSSSNSNAYGNQLRGGMAGMRLAIHPPILPLKPYLQAEVGAATTNYGVQANRSLNFAYQVQGGVDWRILPHVDVRGEYGGGKAIGSLGGSSITLQEFGAGIVLRL